jgi:hypothetical protein
MNQLSKCLHLYLGCNTNKGKFIGIKEDILLIQTKEDLIDEYTIQNVGNTLFLYLRQLSDLTDEQSNQLIKEGFSIGRPHGYTFSNYGFLYLLSLSVDLFGLINAGYAKDIKTLGEKDY